MSRFFGHTETEREDQHLVDSVPTDSFRLADFPSKFDQSSTKST
jgi:hypothetical protein